MAFILIVTYAAVIVFLTAVFSRYIKLATMPLHLRWELYPVAHEKGRAHYGGSYLEEPDWWTKPRHTTLLGELKVMIPEILLLAGVWEHNRKQWYRSFPFHFGLYLLAGLIALLVIGGIACAVGADISPEGGILGKALYHLTYLLGYGGLGLALLGSLALLVRRLFEPDYREYTTKVDFISLFLFVTAFGVALAAHILADPLFIGLRGYFQCLVTFDLSAAGAGTGLAALQGVEIILASLLVAYIPLTHMSHFFTKWFTYHHIRWSDEPNLKGGHFENKIGNEMKSPVSWSAPHIRGDGVKNWVDVATSGVEETEE